MKTGNGKGGPVTEKLEIGALRRGLQELGCGEGAAERICRLYAAGQREDAILCLRRHRCTLMDLLHESQGRVDRLDLLLREMQKDNRESERMESI